MPLDLKIELPPGLFDDVQMPPHLYRWMTQALATCRTAYERGRVLATVIERLLAVEGGGAVFPVILKVTCEPLSFATGSKIVEMRSTSFRVIGSGFGALSRCNK